MSLWNEPELEREINEIGRRFVRRREARVIGAALLLAAAIAALMLGFPEVWWVRLLYGLIPGVQLQEMSL